MMKLTDTLIGLMLYALIADGRDLIIYNLQEKMVVMDVMFPDNITF